MDIYKLSIFIMQLVAQIFQGKPECMHESVFLNTILNSPM